MSDLDHKRAQFALAYGRTESEHECPPLEQILAWHEKSLDRRQAEKVQGHVAHCERCFAIWSGLVELEPPVREMPVVTTRRRRWWHFAAPVFALSVVAVSLWIGLLGDPPLPAYTLDIRGGMDVRGGDEQTLVLQERTVLRVLVTPATAVDADVAGAAYAVGGGGASRLSVEMDVTDQGVVSLQAVIGRDVVIDPTTRRIVVVVGRRGELPGGEELMRALEGRSQVVTDDWQAFAVPVGSN